MDYRDCRCGVCPVEVCDKKKVTDVAGSGVTSSDGGTAGSSGSSSGSGTYSPVGFSISEAQAKANSKAFVLTGVQESKPTAKGIEWKNACNVTWNGTDNWQGMTGYEALYGVKFLKFTDYIMGYRAALKTIKSYYDKHNLKTCQAIFERYAPAGHGNNNPTAYATFVASVLGCKPADKLEWNLGTMCTLVAAMSWMENNIRPNFQMVKDAWNKM